MFQPDDIGYRSIQDVNVKATNVRTIFRERHLMKDLREVGDEGNDTGVFTVLFK